MKKRQIGYPLLILTIITVVLGIIISLYIKNASESDVKDNTTTPLETRNEELYKEIEEYGSQHKIEPIDAKIDSIWKGIPGYNGMKVNLDKSYSEMKADGKFSESKVVYSEISPKVHLDDLGPHPVYRGNPEKPMVTFLINVAWGNEFIPDILKTLDKHQMKTTFFFDGSWVKKNPDIAKTIYKAGHEIGNHAYTHPDLESCSREKTMEELKKTNDVIEETLGIKPNWFAPPSGSFNDETIQVAHELGMKTILWTADTVDWRKPETSEMVNRVLSQVENGTMILMHPTKPSSEGLDAMIKDIKEKGYRLGTVSEMMDEGRVQ